MKDVVHKLSFSQSGNVILICQKLSQPQCKVKITHKIIYPGTCKAVAKTSH